MTVILGTGYTLPANDEPLTHARVAHSGNWFTGTASASSTDAGFFTEAPLNTLTYEFWQTSSFPASWTLSTTSQEADYCAIAAHNFGQCSAQIEVQYWDGSVWQDLIATTIITTNEPIFVIFEPQTADQFRLRIAGVTFGPGIPNPRVGVIKFGKALQMEQPIFSQYQPPAYSRVTTFRSNDSDTGEFVGTTFQRTHLDFPLQWDQLTRDWADANWLPAIKAIEREPFFCAPIPSVRQDVSFGKVRRMTPFVETSSGFGSAGMQVIARGYD